MKIVILVILNDENPSQTKAFLSNFSRSNQASNQNYEGITYQSGGEAAIRFFSMSRFANHCNGIGSDGGNDPHLLQMLGVELRKLRKELSISYLTSGFVSFREIQKFPIPAQCKGHRRRFYIKH